VAKEHRVSVAMHRNQIRSALYSDDQFDSPDGWRREYLMEVPTLAQVIVWIAVGLIGGSLVGFMMTWERRGFGLPRNMAIGLAGAFIGGLLFRMFGLFPALDRISIPLRDVVAAVVGSPIILAVYWIWQRSRKS